MPRGQNVAPSGVNTAETMSPGTAQAGFVSTEEPGAPRLDGLQTLGDVAQHEDRAAEGGRLLLYAARVGEDERRRAHQLDQRHVVERRKKTDALVIGKAVADRVSHV